ncbi:tyrosine-protein phosphatase [Chloroflexota bacterium]
MKTNCDPYSQQISFESIHNFRDLGGYHTNQGDTVAWRKLFRSANLSDMTINDFIILRDELKLTSVMDLRNDYEIQYRGTGLVSNSDLKYYNVPLISDGGDREVNIQRYRDATNMGEFYLQLSRQKEFSQRIIEALEIIADPANHPLVFHCSAGKDRTGILSAIILGTLEVTEENIVKDYCLSSPYTKALYIQVKNESPMSINGLPDYFWTVSPELMVFFLTNLREEYGSVRQYVKEKGADLSSIRLLESTLLI